MSEMPAPARLVSAVMWRRSDGSPSLDHCRLHTLEGRHLLSGRILTVLEDVPAEVHYLVSCDARWTTEQAHVTLVRGDETTKLHLRRDEAGAWWRDDHPLTELQGISDVDISLTPATNTLPVRRLALEMGGSASVDAAWIRFPDLEVVRLPQRYVRTGERRYRYESDGGAFRADLEVDEEGVVVRYGDIWERVSA